MSVQKRLERIERSITERDRLRAGSIGEPDVPPFDQEAFTRAMTTLLAEQLAGLTQDGARQTYRGWMEFYTPGRQVDDSAADRGVAELLAGVRLKNEAATGGATTWGPAVPERFRPATE